MPSLLERLPSGSRIVVIRLRSIGDCVLTTPALALLKEHRPDLRLAVVVEDRFRAVFEENPDIDEILSPRIGEIGKWRPRLALNLHGGTRSMVLTAASGARIRAGFGHHRYSFLYSAKIPRAQEILGEERPVHTAEHIASAMFWMGVPRGPIPRAKLVASAPFGRGSVTGSEMPDGKYAVLHPFASEPAKTWPAGRFVEIATHLKANGLEPVFVAGPEDDASVFRSFRILRAAPLGQIKSLMAGARIFIGNDSGPAHIAAAFGVPVIAIFGASNPVTWAPWRTEARVLTSPHGINAIETAEAITAIESLKFAHRETRA
jgi:ADP-heptose:LPS heptosyltransferase